MRSHREDRQVWAVAFSGACQPPSCGPPPLTPGAQVVCPQPATTILVIIDGDERTFIEAMSPADTPD